MGDCEAVEGCVTCGDVAVAVTVVAAAGGDASCRTDDGRVEVVAVDLVGPVVPGARLLVHAGVALARLDTDPASRGGG